MRGTTKAQAHTILPSFQAAAVWSAIDRLAADHGLSVSGLAVRAGLNSTTFNPSKRIKANGDWRWPSMGSIAVVLAVTNSPLSTFATLVDKGGNDVTTDPSAGV